MTTARLHDPKSSLSSTFERTAAEIDSHSVTVRDLIGLIGEQALLLLVAFLAVPFLLPVAIPGTSTVFGLVILVIGIGVMLNRIPLLPARLLDHPLRSHHVVSALQATATLARRFERLIRPRWLALSDRDTINRFNGLILVTASLVLMVPLPLVPFTNTLPAIGILLLAVGMAERDGVLIALGYIASFIATAYVAALVIGIFVAGANAAELLQRWFG